MVAMTEQAKLKHLAMQVWNCFYCKAVGEGEPGSDGGFCNKAGWWNSSSFNLLSSWTVTVGAP